MRKFPIEFEKQKDVLYYPRRPDKFSGDILEIGPGRGDFLISLAEKYSEKQLTAIELDKRRYYKLIPRIEKRGLFNILLIQGNARVVLPQSFKKGTFEKIYVLFPDPWPKRRHVPQRLMSVEFIGMLASLLRAQGFLYCSTDFWAYADMVVDNAARVESLDNTGRPYFSNIEDIPDYSPSFFEQKWRDEGRTIYYISLKRK